MKKWDVVIIGSGISSLTCAALLTKKGKSVCILEQYNKPGGYLHCFNRFGDRFDTGAHYVGAMSEGQPFHTLLSYLGVYDENLFVPLDADGFDVLKFPHFTIELPKGYTQTISRLSEHFPQEKEGIKTYFSKVAEVGKHFPTYEFNESRDLDSILHLLETPLSKVVQSVTGNRQLQSVLYAYCALHGVIPEEVSFGLHAVMTDSLIRGPYGFTQGGEALARKFVDRIERGGGKVFLNKRAVEIETVGKTATAVVTADGERFETSWVISGVHPKATFALLKDPGIFSVAFRQRMKNIKESGGIFGVYAACNSQPGLNLLKNYYYFGTDEPSQLFSDGQPGAKPSVVFLSPANRTAENSKNAFTMNIHAQGPMKWFEPYRETQLGKRPEEYRKLKELYAQNVLDFVDDFEPGLKKSICKYVTSSPVTNLHFNGSWDGSSYGIYHSIENTGARALGPRTHVLNLLLTGQSCLFPGLLASTISGLRTAGHVVGIKPMVKELRLLKENTPSL